MSKKFIFDGRINTNFPTKLFHVMFWYKIKSENILFLRQIYAVYLQGREHFYGAATVSGLHQPRRFSGLLHLEVDYVRWHQR
jgi:hypothetical protein